MFQKGGQKKDQDSDTNNQNYGDNPFELKGSRDNDDFFGGRGRGSEKDDEEIENELYANKTPWDMRLTYVASYNNNNRQSEITNHSLMFSGNIQLTPKWDVGFNSGYDFKNKGFTDTRFSFNRDLDSFRINFDWTPFGRFERWYFFIGIKSSLLSDLKWENRSQPFRR